MSGVAPVCLIVGAGPVGLTLALELTRYGVPIRLIDQAAHRTETSKALVVWARTLELLDRARCAQPFLAAGMRVTVATIHGGGAPIARIDLDAVPSPYPFALMLPQSETERLLEEQLRALGVLVERSTALTAVSQDGDHVHAGLRHADGRDEACQIPWVIGCDGAHSVVRHQLGMTFTGSTQPSDWDLADVHLSGLGASSAEISIFWHADGVLAIFPIAPGRYRVIADVGTASDESRRPAPTLDEIRGLVARRGPPGIEVTDPIWLSSFRINERKVAQYRSGRVFVAGDAAHVHSPAGGQGMNTGMQDAFNLAWKLALVVRGTAAAEPLLDSYSGERSAVGDQVLADAGRMTAIATLDGPIMQFLRNHIGGMVFGLSAVRHAMAVQFSELSIGYPHSPLTVPGYKAPGPGPGERAPVIAGAAPVGSGPMPCFSLSARPSPAIADLQRRFPDLIAATLYPASADHGIWLIRPDGYIAVVASDHDVTPIAHYLAQFAPHP